MFTPLFFANNTVRYYISAPVSLEWASIIGLFCRRLDHGSMGAAREKNGDERAERDAVQMNDDQEDEDEDPDDDGDSKE